MGLSQPSVSLQIQALERDLGTQLFERRGPVIRLTRDGETLLELARPLVEGMDALDEDLRAKIEEFATAYIEANTEPSDSTEAN